MNDVNKINCNQGKWAIVTGASKGLGLAYFKSLLRMGYNVVGVARNTSSLKDVPMMHESQQIKLLNYDLSVMANVFSLFDDVNQLDVWLIINNAGFGVWGYFEQTSLDDELNMIDLNIKAMHALTKLFVQKFVKQNYGRVINIGSVIAGNCPGPVFAGYYATKAYVWNLSNAINFELKKRHSPIRVVAICPGILKTDFWQRSSNQNDTIFCKTNVKTLPVDRFAQTSLLRAIKSRNKNVIIVGANNKLARWASVHLPKWLFWSRLYEYQRNK